MQQNMKSCRNTFYQTFNYRKKLFYAVSSFLLSIALMCTGVFDLTCLLAFERPDLTTHNAMATIMILHVFAFYLSLFGFVHSFEAKQHILSNIAVLAGGLTVASLILRVVQELVFVGFYPPEYAVT